MEKVVCFRYLGIKLSASGRIEEELFDKVGKGIKVFEALRNIQKGKNVSSEAKVEMYESIATPTVLNSRKKQGADATEIKCLK